MGVGYAADRCIIHHEYDVPVNLRFGDKYLIKTITIRVSTIDKNRHLALKSPYLVEYYDFGDFVKGKFAPKDVNLAPKRPKKPIGAVFRDQEPGLCGCGNGSGDL